MFIALFWPLLVYFIYGICVICLTFTIQFYVTDYDTIIYGKIIIINNCDFISQILAF